jgi:UDP-glucuronate decarboxylase
MQASNARLGLWSNPIVAEDMEYLSRALNRAPQFDGATVLVTGAAGFLGFYISHFLFYLMEQGGGPRSLILLDTFLLGKPAWVEELARASDRVHIRSFDIAKDRIADVPGAEHADYVIHMASIASPIFYRKYPLETLDANVGGLRNLLDYYRDKPLKGLLFFSSSEIYGDPSPENIPTAEDYRGNVACLGPRACYDEAKRFGETVCYVFAEKYGSPIRIVRPFNNYGPGMNKEDRRAPADFIKCVLSGHSIVLHSNGAPTRTFCYIADAIAGYLKALLHDRFDAFNIGIDRPEISVLQLAQIFRDAGRRLNGYTGEVIFEASPDKNYLTDNPNRRCPDISKARRVLQFDPTILVEAGVEKFLKFYLWLEQQKRG